MENGLGLLIIYFEEIMKKTLLSIALLSTFGSASAEQLSYDFVQVAAIQTEFADIVGFKAKGFEVKGSYEFYPNVFTEVTYFSADDTANDIKFDVDQWQVKAGYIQRLSSNTALDYSLGYGKIEFDYRKGELRAGDETNYYSLNTSIRHMLVVDVEVYAGLGIQKWKKGSDQKYYTLGSQYTFGDFVAGASYTKFSDSEVFAITGRYTF